MDPDTGSIQQGLLSTWHSYHHAHRTSTSPHTSLQYIRKFGTPGQPGGSEPGAGRGRGVHAAGSHMREVQEAEQEADESAPG